MKLIPQNEVDAAFMEELKDAVRDRNATIDEVIALIRSNTYGMKSLVVDVDRLVSDIADLKS